MRILRIHDARVLRIHGLSVMGIHNRRIHIRIVKIEKLLRLFYRRRKSNWIQISLTISCIGATFLTLVVSFFITVLLDQLFHIIFGKIENIIDTYCHRRSTFDNCGFICHDHCGNVRFLVNMAEFAPNIFKWTFLSFFKELASLNTFLMNTEMFFQPPFKNKSFPTNFSSMGFLRGMNVHHVIFKFTILQKSFLAYLAFSVTSQF